MAPVGAESTWKNYGAFLNSFHPDGLQNHSKQVHTPVALLRSLLDKYPWERYEPPYPPSYGLNSTTTVLLGE